MADSLQTVTAEVVACRKCPRLVAWREETGRNPPARFRGEPYWSRPVPGFGDREARLLVVGLAPAANGGNRTGRIFTGDASGDWLYRALHRSGFANQPTSQHRGDGLELRDCYVAAVVRCAPPANRPTPEERDNCLAYLAREIAMLPRLRVIMALGAFAWDGTLRALRQIAISIPKPRPPFAHGAEAAVGAFSVFGSYHPSQQNTFTGKLTEGSFDNIFARARVALAPPAEAPAR